MVFSIMEKNPDGGEPYNTAVIIDPQGGATRSK